MRARFSRLIGAALVLAAPASPADHPTQGPATLAGIPAVEVEVESFQGPLAENGVRPAQLRRAVVAALKEAGVPTGKGMDAAVLHLRLDTRQATRKFLALSINLTLRQHVRLERDPDRILSAVTWSNGAVTPLRKGTYEEVPERVAGLVARTFVPDFLAANPPAGSG